MGMQYVWLLLLQGDGGVRLHGNWRVRLHGMRLGGVRLHGVGLGGVRLHGLGLRLRLRRVRLHWDGRGCVGRGWRADGRG